jgi:hypothetical protein
MIAFARRACAVLYNVLTTRRDERPFLIPANACAVVPATFVEAGQRFELVDVEEPSLTIDRAASLELLRARPHAYAGMLFVRPYGAEHDPTSFFSELKAIRPDLLVIDDKCLCRPDPLGRSLSSAADVTLFSTGHTKYADLDGGGFAHLRAGLPYRQADVSPADWLDLRAPDAAWDAYVENVLAATDAADEQKAALNAIYAQHIPAAVQLPPEFQNWRFNLRVAAADELIASTFAAGLFASRHYPSLAPRRFPVADRLQSTIVNLFNDRYFDRERATRMAELVAQHLQRHAPSLT